MTDNAVTKLSPVPQQTALSVWERLVTDPSIPIERLVVAKDLMRSQIATENEAAFGEALAAAQGEMEPIRRDMDNPQTSSRYASLAAVVRAIQPIYTRHGMAIDFNSSISPRGPEWVRFCAKARACGHTEVYDYDVKADGLGPKGAPIMTQTHAMGAASTYARRQLLKMIFNLAEGGDDTDGNMPLDNDVSSEQIEELERLLNLVGRTPELFCRKFRIETIGRLPASKYPEAVKFLQQYLRVQK